MELQNTNLMLIFAVFAFTVQTLCFKVFNIKYMKNTASYMFFNFLTSILVAVVFFIFAGTNQNYHLETIIIGIFFGVDFILTVFFYTKAMGSGPLSLTSLFYSCGILVPIVAGVVLWNEKITAVQLIGLMLMIFMFYVMTRAGKSDNIVISQKWIVYSVATLFFNGSLGAMLKYHQMLLPKKEVYEFLSVAFFTSALLCGIFYIWLVKIRKQNIGHMREIGLFGLVIVAGITTGVGNMIYTALSSSVPGVILFPTVSGGVILLCAVTSAMLFKEKITFKDGAGILIGLVAIVFLSIK